MSILSFYGEQPGPPGTRAKAVRPNMVLDSFVSRVNIQLADAHRDGLITADRSTWSPLLVDLAVNAPLDRCGLLGRDRLPDVAYPEHLMYSGTAPNWPACWRELLDKYRTGLPMPALAVLDSHGVPYIALDVCVDEGGFENAVLRLEAANALYYLFRARVSSGPREDALIATGVLTFVPFDTEDTDTIGRTLGVLLGRIEARLGWLSRMMSFFVRPTITVFPSILVPDEWVRRGAGASVWIPVAAMFDQIH